jgi:hypothetical protein
MTARQPIDAAKPAGAVARLGILRLKTRFPRLPGDIGAEATWPFPVAYRVVDGATSKRVVTERAEGLLDDFIAAARELVAAGADGISTTCGFLSLFQKDIAAACDVPVATSSLMQAPMIQRLLPPGRRVGIITVSAAALTADHLAAAGVDPETPVVGTEGGQELTRVLLEDEPTLDAAAAEADMLAAGDALVSRNDDIGAVLLECTNMGPYSRALGDHLGLPVFDVVSFLTWFHAGLRPRDWRAG